MKSTFLESLNSLNGKKFNSLEECAAMAKENNLTMKFEEIGLIVKGSRGILYKEDGEIFDTYHVEIDGNNIVLRSDENSHSGEHTLYFTAKVVELRDEYANKFGFAMKTLTDPTSYHMTYISERLSEQSVEKRGNRFLCHYEHIRNLRNGVALV